MNRAFLIVVCWLVCFKANAEIVRDCPYSLVYVHIGPQLPSYLPIAIAQARLFNPTIPIYLIAQSSELSRYDHEEQEVTLVPIESPTLTNNHRRFNHRAKNTGFWRYALERFLYIDDFIQQYRLQNVFHTENDVMIYFDLGEKLLTFQECYHGMLATVFDCEERSVPSFVYFSDTTCSEKLAEYISLHGARGATDMALLFEFKELHYKKFGDHLPILVPAYAKNCPLISLAKKRTRNSAPFLNHLDKLQLIFDAAAIGQFFGGIDPILGNKGPGFVGELSVFLTHHCKYEWKRDKKGRWVPYISYGGETYPIANLHIHCKNLQVFYSLNQKSFPLPTTIWSSLPLE